MALVAYKFLLHSFIPRIYLSIHYNTGQSIGKPIHITATTTHNDTPKMSMTPTQAKARFVQIASLPDAAVTPFCDLIELLYGRSYRDNRRTRRRAIDRVVAELGMPPGHSSQLGDNLMQHCDSRYEFSTPHRDPHRIRRRKPRTSGASGLMTPEPEQNLDGTTLYNDDDTPEGFGGGGVSSSSNHLICAPC